MHFSKSGLGRPLCLVKGKFIPPLPATDHWPHTGHRARDWTAHWPERFSVLDMAQAFEATVGERIIKETRDMQLQAAFQIIVGSVGEHEKAVLVALFCSLAQNLPLP